MKPHVLLIEPIVPETDAACCVYPLFAAHDREALIAAIGSSVRATFQIGGFRFDLRAEFQHERL